MFKPVTSLLLFFFFFLISTLNVTTTASILFFGNYGPYEDILKNDINYINYNSNSTGTEISEPDPPAPPAAPATNSLVNKKKLVTKTLEPSHSSVPERVVPAGAFFRESKFKKGTVMPMPNITDKMPNVKFLRRKFVSEIPFSSSKLSAMKQIFSAKDGSAMEFIIKEALKNCERKPNPGEIKRCVASAEDMKEFPTSILGPHVNLHKTENNKGSKQNILIGSVTGGKVTETVSCHRMLYPYLLYYCHSVPNVRVYEADILDPKTKKKINHGVAICHLDTSAWSADHAAFKALGSGPGQIEVCHWIFEHDLIWTNADHY